MTNWNKDNTLYFINLLKKHQCLYNILDPSYANKKIKLAAVKEICHSMAKVNFFMTIDQIKQKLRYLKRQFNVDQKHRKQKGNKYKPNLWCYDELMFLRESYDNAPGISNINLDSMKTPIIKHENSPEPENSISSHMKEYLEDSEDDYMYNLKTENIEADNDDLLYSEIFGSPCRQENKISTHDNNTNSSMVVARVGQEGPSTSVPAAEIVKKNTEQKTKRSGNNEESKEEAFGKYLVTRLREIKSDQIYEDTTWQILQTIRDSILLDRLNR